ncbi:hypothetical protein BVG16_15730 [Paenibacillus selenitireducens]|uniref:Uncharacterized protein n=1 Tax=Paenibacillus selenitireducens TaxID=1324314 RepID=A0A1T2X9R4_9BACL|nr:hypothetical protein BVG16_15730 [Paenibacillus selenitireducens]
MSKSFRTERFTWEKGDLQVVATPEQLQCHDCRFRTDRTAKCEKFTKCKPDYVLKRLKDCPEYEKE